MLLSTTNFRQLINTHRFKQAMTEPININQEYKPLMCTKHEFEIKHASKIHFIMKTQPETKSNPDTTQK